MVRVASKSIALVIAVLFLLPGLLPLLAVQPVQAAAPMTCCHRHESAPTPANQHPADHVCCMVGHNHALLTSTTEAPPLQLCFGWQDGSRIEAPLFVLPFESLFGGSSPPARDVSPLRI